MWSQNAYRKFIVRQFVAICGHRASQIADMVTNGFPAGIIAPRGELGIVEAWAFARILTLREHTWVIASALPT
jgi:hypothetical protein